MRASDAIYGLRAWDANRDAARQREDGGAAGFAPANTGVEEAGALWAATKQTGLVYYGFRYYQPQLGRFMTRDPIGDGARQRGDGPTSVGPSLPRGRLRGHPKGRRSRNAGGLNLYRLGSCGHVASFGSSAVNNNPAEAVDVHGLLTLTDDLRHENPPGGRYLSEADFPSHTGGYSSDPHEFSDFTVNGTWHSFGVGRYMEEQVIAAVNGAFDSSLAYLQRSIQQGFQAGGGGSANASRQSSPPPQKDNELPPCSEFLKDGLTLTAQSFIQDEQIDNEVPWRWEMFDSVVPWTTGDYLKGDGRGFLNSPADGIENTVRGSNSITMGSDGSLSRTAYYGQSVMLDGSGNVRARGTASSSKHQSWGYILKTCTDFRFESLKNIEA